MMVKTEMAIAVQSLVDMPSAICNQNIVNLFLGGRAVTGVNDRRPNEDPVIANEGELKFQSERVASNSPLRELMQ